MPVQKHIAQERRRWRKRKHVRRSRKKEGFSKRDKASTVEDGMTPTSMKQITIGNCDISLCSTVDSLLHAATTTKNAECMGTPSLDVDKSVCHDKKDEKENIERLYEIANSLFRKSKPYRRSTY